MAIASDNRQATVERTSLHGRFGSFSLPGSSWTSIKQGAPRVSATSSLRCNPRGSLTRVASMPKLRAKTRKSGLTRCAPIRVVARPMPSAVASS